MKLNIAFIGSGNVAWHLAKAFDKAGHKVSQVISKNEHNAKALAVQFGAYFGNNLSSLYGNLDICFICVPDDKIQEVLDALPDIKTTLVHTCGPKGMDILSNYSAQHGVFYPLQSFSKARTANMLNVPVLLECSGNEVYEMLYNLADSISNKVKEVNSADRMKYHLSAVFANNFTNHLFLEAEQYLVKNGLDFKVLLPIIQETSAKILDLSPAEAQTGPAKRNDEDTINKHLRLLDDDLKLREMYTLLTNAIRENNTLD